MKRLSVWPARGPHSGRWTVDEDELKPSDVGDVDERAIRVMSSGRGKVADGTGGEVATTGRYCQGASHAVRWMNDQQQHSTAATKRSERASQGRFCGSATCRPPGCVIINQSTPRSD